MAQLLEDVHTSAHWIAAALGSSGYRADFSPASLRKVERFMTEHSDSGAGVPGGLLASGLGARLFGLGCYVGETIRSGVGGVWETNDADPQGELYVALRLSSGAVVRPVQRVVKRFRNGPEESLVAYANFVVLEVPAPAQPQVGRRPRWGACGRR
ncbi:hypothetical protein H9Y04_26095 [Streptomyces sp. TRM66268-LWL]|uniref:Uncharacterized protein n=1 Tax=Streptomyces polyasparticus TaxID=2767826 RepID=A0ABR7SNU2_9ACTN|nr:hypothetical protein [Streptomyces polyasparticus]MBC9716018.1 hypothetical protein [Streptomyces polyasparticus]